ncbi:hypothetical protein SORBI_3003G442500 [Sorghum bicolor]|uniref:Glycosyltransferase 2-like domain-containing protein n=1 Tax=Sorghum bicolor TaxID=4558 RepID=C5XJC9_SORBI|nr:hypothetical protein SORBI_3003G442500 [Sorghum bicolor]
MEDGEKKDSQAPPPPLSAVHVNRPLVAANRAMAAVHAALVAAVIAHRVLALLSVSVVSRHVDVAMALADLTLLFLWTLSQSGLWRPVTRAAFPDRLLAAVPRDALPRVDVLVVTADPDKEPPLGVMNTVVSAMALDYPGAALSVYLSDDAGSPLTLLAARKAYAFARAWVPFCRRHSVRCPWPDRYFAGDDDAHGGREELAEERARVKKLYEKLKADIEAANKDDNISGSWTKAERQDHDAYVEIISGKEDGDEEEEMPPALVYVAREKRRAWPDHFKAGALNALLRVSGVVSNAPYVLVLDCDMACNSRASAMDAMCFLLLDDRRSPPTNLAFVQFPQMFHNLSHNDIYTNELRYIFGTRWFGLDGVRGPFLSGTGFYVRRDALYGATPPPGSTDLSSMDAGDLKARFGHSDRLVASLRGGGDDQRRRRRLPPEPVESLVATCAYEAGTAWGTGVGFMYQSVVEDYFTGYQRFFSRGWTSAYCYPEPRPAFLGSVPTNLNDVLVQNKRWMSGMLAVGVSRHHSPLACRPLLRASLLQAMGYAYFGFAALYAVPVLCYATLPQLCLLHGVPLFPCPAAAAAAFASSLLLHLAEVCVARRGRMDLRTWWNEQRFWVLNALTGQLLGCVSAAQELLGARALDFDLTTKAADADGRLYQDGVFDFTGCSTLLLPATTLSVLNAAAIVAGTWKMTFQFAGELLPQLFLMCYGAALSYPLLEGMFLRWDAARVPPRITALSVASAAVLLAVFG